MFALDSRTARIIGTSRIAGNRVDTSGMGIFKGTDTPSSHKFSLRNLELAKASNEGTGYIEKDFVQYFNSKKSEEVTMTLYIADGDSMIHPDIKQRIFATITNALLEYRCTENSDCAIERVQF